MTSTASTFLQAHDQRIQHELMQHIGWQPEVNSKDISVKVNDGNVALSGFVHS